MSNKSYILGQVVARGGMAEVYRGLHVGQDGFKRLVAIKRILPHHAQNSEFTEMFRDEAHIGQRLQHANVVKVEGFDIIDGSASIIMEFVDGSDLRSLLSATEVKKSQNGKKAYVPNDICVYIIAEAARGLHYAHTRRDDISGKPLNIVHRDMSPQNLLVSWEGEVKVTDFGIAAADRDFKATETKAGIVKGKYSYMSPEQISGKKCDPRTDVFALSVVLWEMLAMRRLFTADNEVEVIEMVRNCKIPVRLKDCNPNVTDELEAIVLRGLTKDPRKRYESMESLEKSLRSYLSKSSSPATASDLSAYIKDVMSERRELAQEEMRKILTATHQQAATSKPQNVLHQSVELALEPSSQNTSSLTVGKTRGVGQSPQAADARAGAFNSARPSYIQSGRSDRPARTHEYRISPGARRSSAQDHRKANNAFYMIAALLVLAILGGLYFKNYKNAAKQALLFTIRAVPQTIRVKLNNEDYAGGRYIVTPSKIKLDPGLNSVEILRPGYKTEKILINTDEGIPQPSPAIRLKPRVTFAPVRLEYQGTTPVTISVNEGFYKHAFSSRQTIGQINDISSGIPSELVVTNAEKKILFRCQFTPENTTERRPLIVIIDAAAGQCDSSPRAQKSGAKGDH